MTSRDSKVTEKWLKLKNGEVDYSDYEEIAGIRMTAYQRLRNFGIEPLCRIQIQSIRAKTAAAAKTQSGICQ